MGFYIDNLIEFVLMYQDEIVAAIEDKRNGGNVITGGNSGHSRISDPTANKAIRNASEVASVKIAYGAETWGERSTKTIRLPERWVLVSKAVREYHEHNERTKDFFDRRYNKHEDWRTTCKELSMSRGVYYAMRTDVIHMAELYAAHYGAFDPRDFAKL